MGSHGTESVESLGRRGEDCVKVDSLSLNDDFEEFHTKVSDSEGHINMGRNEKPDRNPSFLDEDGESFNASDLAGADGVLPPCNEVCTAENGDSVVQKESIPEGPESWLTIENGKRGITRDVLTRNKDSCVTKSPQSIAADDSQKGISGTVNHKKGKYFYYDKPLHEETGIWIPVSVPPMTENDNGESTLEFSSNWGYIPDEDMGWNQCIEDDKELTMWDVVLEMLLAARGKFSGLTSADISRISFISTRVMEHAWKELAQSLTEANFSNAREILDSLPPKWLPDSATSSCMLCSVRFHPIMCKRHHCRFCGGVFCNECTKGRSLLPEKFRTENPKRVCDVCGVRLEPFQPYLMDQVSRAAQLPIHDLMDLSTLRSWVNFPWGQTMEYEIYKATNTILGYAKVVSLRSEKKIPQSILQDAKGLAILTVVRVGMVVTYNVGTGLVIARRDDGSWSPPSAISSFGLGWGAQAGGGLTDFIIVLRNHEAVKTFCSEAHFSVGAGMSAAAGTIGRTAEADVRAGTNGYSAACYTYSCSKGAFLGCSLESSMVTTRAQENSRFYGKQSVAASDILLGSMPQPPAAGGLYRALGDLFLHLEQ